LAIDNLDSLTRLMHVAPHFPPSEDIPEFKRYVVRKKNQEHLPSSVIGNPELQHESVGCVWNSIDPVEKLGPDSNPISEEYFEAVNTELNLLITHRLPFTQTATLSTL